MAPGDAAPQPPLLVAEGWDLTFFRSGEALGRYLEPWFPADVEYRAWDARGRRLILVVEETPPSRGLFRRLARPDGHVVARVVVDAPDEPEKLRAYLRAWFEQVGVLEPPREASLSDLLVQALTHGDIR